MRRSPPSGSRSTMEEIARLEEPVRPARRLRPLSRLRGAGVLRKHGPLRHIVAGRDALDAEHPVDHHVLEAVHATPRSGSTCARPCTPGGEPCWTRSTIPMSSRLTSSQNRAASRASLERLAAPSIDSGCESRYVTSSRRAGLGRSREHEERVVRERVQREVREEPREARALASSSSSVESAGSPCQPPSSVFAAIGDVQKPVHAGALPAVVGLQRGDLHEPRDAPRAGGSTP